MKRIIAVVLIALMLCGMLCISASAEYVASPEYEEPEQSEPSSPQTGYGFGILSVAALALLSGTAAVIIGKKVLSR